MTKHPVSRKLMAYARHPTMSGQTQVPQAILHEAIAEIERLQKGYGGLFDKMILARNARDMELLQDAIDQAAVMSASQ